MRRIIAIVLIVAVSGCVRPAPQLPAVQGLRGPGSTSWHAVQWLPHQQFIFVTVDGGETRAASLYAVSDTAVTLWYDSRPYTIPRGSVTQVVARVQIGEKQDMPWGQIAAGAAMVIGSTVGISLWDKHTGKNKDKAAEEVTGMAVFGTIGLLWGISDTKAKPVYEDRLVYIRP